MFTLKCEIISVGTELLLGQIVNTNAKYLSEKLASIGIDIYYHTNVGDNQARLKDCLGIAFKRSNLIITTGGLGPTTDDITKETISLFLGLPLIEDYYARQQIEEYFNKINEKPTINNYKQACFPKGSKILPNDKGTAPGCIVETENATIIMLPGPPSELIPMFDNYVYPYLKDKNPQIIKSRVIKIFGVGESKVEEMVKELLNNSNPTVAPLIGDGFVTLRITAKSDNENKAFEMIKEVEYEIRNILKDYIFAIDNESMESVVVNLLRKNSLTISTAESCTGGLLSGKLTDVEGASDVFKLGLITYSNESKQKLLGVQRNTLEKYGAVSHQTAEEMAHNVRKIANTDFGISITGIAGPGGGSIEKPVGLVYIGFSSKENEFVKKTIFNGDRYRIRTRSVLYAMDILRRYILGLKID